MTTGPTAELDGRFSSEDANATPWADVADGSEPYPQRSGRDPFQLLEVIPPRTARGRDPAQTVVGRCGR